MTSRERVELSFNHKEPDRIPLDLGGGPQTGMHVSSVYKLRQALNLDDPKTPVKVIEPYQMLGEIKNDLIEALGIDFVPLWGRGTMFGYPLDDWKEWTAFDGTPVLVPGKFNTKPNEDGSIYQYAEGDESVAPSSVMPKGGFYFDAIVRQNHFDENNLNIEDNLEEFGPMSDKDLNYFSSEAEQLFNKTDKAIYANIGGTSFGDIALVPAVQLKNPKGIRDIEEWYISGLTRPDYVTEIFKRQCEIGLENIKKFYDAVGNKISVIFISGTDFGTQDSTFIDPELFKTMYKPFYKTINDWIHKNTKWKTFIHSCGSVKPLYNDFIEAGFDALNPVQTSAFDMNPADLKSEFGKRATFYGGAIDTQKTLPFGTPDEVRQEVIDKIKIFAPGGGFIFNPIHNVQAGVPVENLLTLYNTFKEYSNYPIKAS